MKGRKSFKSRELKKRKGNIFWGKGKTVHLEKSFQNVTFNFQKKVSLFSPKHFSSSPQSQLNSRSRFWKLLVAKSQVLLANQKNFRINMRGGLKFKLSCSQISLFLLLISLFGYFLVIAAPTKDATFQHICNAFVRKVETIFLPILKPILYAL